jgi:thiamine biosynthesis lipoprotein ApbE
MANNRLYIGNKQTGEFVCIGKSGDGGKWREFSNNDFAFIQQISLTDNIWNTSTDLVIFTESDDMWWDFFHNYDKDKDIPIWYTP